jgi:threonine-phosphate decarboxylase
LASGACCRFSGNRRKQLDAWPVSTIALEAGRAALGEEEYVTRTSCINAQAREELAAALREIGLTVFPSAANFLLVKLPRGSGAELARWLESSRVLIRRRDSFSGLGTFTYGSPSDLERTIYTRFP